MISNHTVIMQLLDVSEDQLISISLMLDPIDVLNIRLSCTHLAHITDLVIPTLARQDEYVIGDVFRLNKWCCNYPALAKYGHRRLIKQTICPNLCLRYVTDHEMILDLLKLVTKVDADSLNNSAQEGYIDIVSSYNIAWNNASRGAICSKSLAMYNYLVGDKSSLSGRHLNQACINAHPDVVRDIISYIGVSTNTCHYVYSTGEPDLMMLAESVMPIDVQHLEAACNMDKLSIVRDLVPKLEDLSEVEYHGNNIDVIRLLMHNGWRGESITLHAICLSKDADLLDLALEDFNDRLCYPMHEYLELLVPDLELICKFINAFEDPSRDITIAAYKTGFYEMLELNPDAMYIDKFIGACLGNNLSALEMLDLESNIDEIRDYTYHNGLNLNAMADYTLRYLACLGVIDLEQALNNYDINASHVKVVVEMLGLTRYTYYARSAHDSINDDLAYAFSLMKVNVTVKYMKVFRLDDKFDKACDIFDRFFEAR